MTVLNTSLMPCHDGNCEYGTLHPERKKTGKAEAPFLRAKVSPSPAGTVKVGPLRGSGKKSPRLRFAPGSIFPGNLDSTGRTMLFALKRVLPRQT
jgi:hypothetical protein